MSIRFTSRKLHRAAWLPHRWPVTLLGAAWWVMAGLTGAPQVHAQATSPGNALPSLGDATDLDLRAERQLGDRIARELYRDPDFIDDPITSDYVQTLWRPLLVAARQRGEIAPELDSGLVWEVMLSRERSINAFALPGGYLGMHLGLVAASANRDELAAVLAHELSHVTQRHIARMVTQSNRQAPWVMGAMILGAIAASKNPQAAGAMITGAQAAAIQGQLNYSRDMEREADRVGLGILMQAGFDPQGSVTLFDKLQLASRLNDSGAFAYLRTHPLTTERMADMQARLSLQAGAADGRGATQAVSRLEHALISARARVLSNTQVDALRLRVSEVPDGPEGAAGPGAVTAGSAPTEPALYAAALAHLKLRDFARAARLAAQLEQRVSADAAALRQARLLAMEIALEMPAADGAQARITELLTRWPLPADAAQASRAQWLLWTRAKQALGQHDEAATRLQTWVALHPRDALAWQQLATVQQARGQVLRSVRAEAEVQVARLDYAAALDRLRAAQDLLRQPSRGGQPADHIEASIIDTRAREVSALLREQALQR